MLQKRQHYAWTKFGYKYVSLNSISSLANVSYLYDG